MDENIVRETSAGIIVYRRTKEGPKFLLLYHGGHYWNFAKGKIEAEPSAKADALALGMETSFHAAIRETAEETGLKEKDLMVKGRFKAYEKYFFLKNKQKIFKVVIFYLAETKKRNIFLSDEHEGYGWFLYRDARRMLKNYKDSESVLKKANDFIRV